jgi:amino acid transporter
MESASFSVTAGGPAGSGSCEKGLKTGAIGFLSNLVIGVASVAPGYSIAATLGLIAAIGGIGLHSPAIMIAGFIPMLCIAFAYRYLNQADPDCGTTFAWVTRAMGPRSGWLNGWAIIVADIVVMASLAQIAGIYTFLLFGWDSAANSTAAVTAVGVLWIVVMTWIVTVGIELSARSQQFLLGIELAALTLFSVVALVKVYGSSPPSGSVHVHAGWYSPFAVGSFSALIAGVLLAVFIYWGWDSGVAVNEETEDPSKAPGKAAVLSTFVLIGIYVLVSTAAQAFHGASFLADNSDDVLSALAKDVFGSPLDKIVIIAVLTSASASTQTTILPTARTALSMSRWGALPKKLGEVHPRFQTPHIATILMGIASIVWYVALTILSENTLFDSLDALGLMIAFYYGFTGFACVWYYRRQLFDSARNFFYVGLLPLAGGLMLAGIFGKSVYDLKNPANSESGSSWFGLGPPLVIAIFFAILGVVLMEWDRRAAGRKGFWARKTETADPAILAEPPGTPPVAPPVGPSPAL